MSLRARLRARPSRLGAAVSALLIGAVAAVPAAAAPAPAAADAVAPAATANGEVIVHLFQWPWDSVAAECENVLGPQGYGAVQVSPPQEHVVLPGEGHPWWQDYQPVSYGLESRRGDAQDFADMIASCRESGVRIYVDAVVNHMTGSGSVNSGPGSGGSSFTKYTYPGIYGDQDFHYCRRDISNWNDPNEVRTCELVGLSDLATGSGYVRGRLNQYLSGLVGMGVAGFRVDAAKHMHPADLAAILGGLGQVPGFGGAPYVYQEVIEDAAISPREYTGSGDVSDFRFHHTVSDAFRDGDIARLRDLPGGMAVSSEQAQVFVDNHDTQRSSPTLTFRDGARYDLATGFMLAYPFGTPTVMSSYDFSDTDQGPPAQADGTTTPVDCGATWVCEHRRTTVAGLVGFRNATAGTGVTDWWSGAHGQIAFGRGGAGYAVFNTGAALTRTFDSSLPAGTYCDVASGSRVDGSGGCTGAAYTVGADGGFTATVPTDTALALHIGQRAG
ncbi:alpha-amylase [Allonocardiopsis opalescens]|uniref:Alpha-amylase n=1 Tax=Allonocardiopsis opalescens TaxID=1144618 RepID=A0A2T0Q1Z2_9ACTN|nr:alpha-amylase family protein [Allonocardiopsis opalescens]PRX97813.1 alpha-amylase [Allonocardiopsis opalescens]